MPKRLVVCCDGTWNTPDQANSPTNVTKVALALAKTDESGNQQRVYYQPGVGTARGERFRGGAFGFGLSRDVRSAYRFLVDNYEPGDDLYFFGFSRGAYTARSTVGLVRNAGILRRQHAQRIDDAYALYRSAKDTEHPHGIEAELFRRSYSYEPEIHFIGVWDTVGSLGIPVGGPRLLNVVNRRWQFHDTALSSKVRNAFHALALDEERGPFTPTLWTGRPSGQQRVEQVWFSGVHCDVGGGYPEHELSDITLLWMKGRAIECGLTFDGSAFGQRHPGVVVPERERASIAARTAVYPNLRGRKHDSRTALYKLVPAVARTTGGGLHEHVASSASNRRKVEEAAGLLELTTNPFGALRVTDVECLSDAQN